jgi:hypothetical protein
MTSSSSTDGVCHVAPAIAGVQQPVVEVLDLAREEDELMQVGPLRRGDPQYLPSACMIHLWMLW